jgi:hypothetical protein
MPACKDTANLYNLQKCCPPACKLQTSLPVCSRIQGIAAPGVHAVCVQTSGRFASRRPE